MMALLGINQDIKKESRKNEDDSNDNNDILLEPNALFKLNLEF